MADPAVHLLVTVDTEEDDWIPTRGSTTAENILELPRLQELLEEHGVRPTYLVTHRVATDPDAADLLAGLREEDRAEVGAHLHPWNTPPFLTETGRGPISIADLPEDLQGKKLRTLTRSVTEAIDIRPVSFRAGRWSFSSDLTPHLVEQGYRVDSSVLPYMYWHDVYDSPSFYRAPLEPYRLEPGGDLQRHAPDGALLEVPATAGYTRWPWRLIGPLDRLVRTPVLHPFHIHGILHRTGILSRIALGPEQFTADEMLTLTDVGVTHGVRCLNVFFHSGVLLPGATPYAATEDETDAFLERVDRLLTGLRERVEVRPLTLGEAADRWLGPTSDAAPAAGAPGG